MLDDDHEIAKKTIGELRRDNEKRGEVVDARLAILSSRLDTLGRESKKRDLDAWRGLVAQLARQHGTIGGLEAKLGTITEKLDQPGAELRRLRFDLGDDNAKPWAPLALPAPA